MNEFPTIMIKEDIPVPHSFPPNTYRDTVTVIDGRIFINAQRFPPLPRKVKSLNPLIVGDKIYISGYEWRGHRWKRTLSAFFAQFIGYFI